jgi:hypothetical protein
MSVRKSVGESFGAATIGARTSSDAKW